MCQSNLPWLRVYKILATLTQVIPREHLQTRYHSEMKQENIEHVSVYGALHSPWVQAVLLGLHEKGIPHSVQPIPSLSSLIRSGLMMPAAKINDGLWQLDSEEILKSLGYEGIDKIHKRAIFPTWDGVLHRVDNPFEFFHGFSLNKYDHPSFLVRGLRSFLRPFITYYFFTLISFLILTGKRRDPDNFADQFLPWERRLSQTGSKYFGGSSPNAVDLQLFGILQCHCSIPYDPLIETIQSDPALPQYRKWIGHMQRHFADYKHLYSGQYFGPETPLAQRSDLLERVLYWFGALLMLMLLPITLLSVCTLALLPNRNY